MFLPFAKIAKAADAEPEILRSSQQRKLAEKKRKENKEAKAKKAPKASKQKAQKKKKTKTPTPDKKKNEKTKREKKSEKESQEGAKRKSPQLVSEDEKIGFKQNLVLQILNQLSFVF